jgi:hypothetical protein
LNHFKIESEDKFFKSPKPTIIYYQIVAICARNALMFKNNPSIIKQLKHDFEKENLRKRKRDEIIGPRKKTK